MRCAPTFTVMTRDSDSSDGIRLAQPMVTSGKRREN
jgi:hypothetical protein